MSATSVANALPGSVRNGRGFLCRCPVPSHGKGKGDRRPSCSIADGDDGKLLVKCFARCDPRDVLAELRKRGLLDDQRESTNPRRRRPKPPPPPVDPEPDAEAIELWGSAISVRGTMGEAYLHSRRISLELPPSIRFIQAAEYLPRIHFPALVAAMQGPDRRVIAAQLTFLDPQGRSKARVARPRKTVGKLGRGAVRLGPAGLGLGIAEGLETALSAMQIFGVPVWACLGAWRMESLWLPPEVEHLTIYADRDVTGRDNAMKAAERFQLTRRVSVKFPPEGDWNDASQTEEAAE